MRDGTAGRDSGVPRIRFIVLRDKDAARKSLNDSPVVIAVLLVLLLCTWSNFMAAGELSI